MTIYILDSWINWGNENGFLQMLVEEKQSGQAWTPSKIVHRLGKEINNEELIYYWAHKTTFLFFLLESQMALLETIYFCILSNTRGAL